METCHSLPSELFITVSRSLCLMTGAWGALPRPGSIRWAQTCYLDCNHRQSSALFGGFLQLWIEQRDSGAVVWTTMWSKTTNGKEQGRHWFRTCCAQIRFHWRKTCTVFRMVARWYLLIRVETQNASNVDINIYKVLMPCFGIWGVENHLRAVLLFEFSVQHEFISGSKASGLLCCSFCMSFAQQGRKRPCKRMLANAQV